MTRTELPAIVIQTTFLAANIACLLSGRCDGFILASITLLMIIFIIQTTSRNERFWWLFPTRIPEKIPTPSWDTMILKGLIVLSIVSFYVGVTSSYGWPALILAIAILVIAVAFPKVWDKWIDQRNERNIARIVEKGQQAMRQQRQVDQK